LNYALLYIGNKLVDIFTPLEWGA